MKGLLATCCKQYLLYTTYLGLSSGVTINCTVNCVRKYSTNLPQGGLDVPCKLMSDCNQAMIEEVRRLLPKSQRIHPVL